MFPINFSTKYFDSGGGTGGREPGRIRAGGGREVGGDGAGGGSYSSA